MCLFKNKIVEAINGFVGNTSKKESPDSILSVFLFDNSCNQFMNYYKVN